MITEHLIPLRNVGTDTTETINFEDISKDYEYSTNDKILVMNYLEIGIPIASTMCVVESLIDRQIIGGMGYLTDGEWIWSSYLAFYVNKINMSLEDDFLFHIKETKIVPDITEIKRDNAIKYLKNLLANSWKLKV